MRNKLKAIILISAISVTSVVAYFYFFGKQTDIIIGVPENNTLIGDIASYVNYVSCDEYSKAVIDKLEIDKDKIHSCESNKIENEEFYLVEIQYGEAQDCPAGCFYETSVYKVSTDKKVVEEFVDGIEEEN